MKMSGRAHRHEDRGGDPLDGLVNLFDLGIVLSVAFLLAALSSADLENVLTDSEARDAAAAAANAVTANPDEVTKEIQLDPGERVVGNGEEIGKIYRLEDGSTIIVRPKDEQGVTGEGNTIEGTEVTPEGTTTVPEGTTTPETTTSPETPAPPGLPTTPESPTPLIPPP